ncbi:MAG: hypothetical protein Q9226_007433, partial [Calogaya cf. arnoldii]
PDFRLRRQRGQVRVHFRGSSAKALAKCDVRSGDHLNLNLLDAQWERDETASGTPRRGIEWELRFNERVVLQIQREDQEPINLDIDHPAPSPERRKRSPPSLDLPGQSHPPSTPVAFPAVPSRLQAWSTPAFLKRDRLSGNSYFGSDYDPFDEDEFRDNSRRKKTKYGRASNQWRFTEQESSPESANGSTSPPTEPLAVNGAHNKFGEDHVKIAESQALGEDNADSNEKRAEDQPFSHGPLVDAGVQVDDGLVDDGLKNQLTAETRPHDALTSPVIAPRSPTPAPKHYPSTDPREAENTNISESIEITIHTTTPVHEAVPSTSLDSSSPDQDDENIGNAGAAYSPLSSQGRPPRSASLRSLSEDGQRNLVELNQAAEGRQTAEGQELLDSKAGEGDSLRQIFGRSFVESVEGPSQDERSPSPVLSYNDTREIREDYESVVQGTSPEEPQKLYDPASSPANTVLDELETRSVIRDIEGAPDIVSLPQDPLPKIIDQGDLGIIQEPTQAVPESYITETHTVTIAEISQIRSQIRSPSPTKYSVNMVSRNRDTKSVPEEDLAGSSRLHDPSPEQLATLSAQSPQDDIGLRDAKAQGETFVQSESEKDAQAQSPSPDMLDFSDSEGAEPSGEDLIMDDESQKYKASENSEEGRSLFQSEMVDYYDEENQEMVAPQRSSAVEIITIEDSDEDDVDVARSQTDGAAMSILHDSRHQSRAIDSLLPKRKGGSPVHSSPPPPDTIPDSQAAGEAGEPDSDIESATAEAKETNVSSPSTSHSVTNSDFREDSEDLVDGAEIKTRLLTASLSPETRLGKNIDPRIQNKVLTPNDTQPREELSQASRVSSRSFRESHDLPTPQLTQNRSSDILLPATLRPSSPSARSSSSSSAPAAESSPPPHRNESSAHIDQDLVDQLRKVKDRPPTFTALKPSPRPRRVSNIPPSLSPWFAPRRSGEVVPDSRSQSPDENGESDANFGEELAEQEKEQEKVEEEEEAEEDEGVEDEDEEDEEIPSSGVKPPIKPPTSSPVFQRTSPTATLPTSTPSTGLRTSHAYYTPLSNLPSHFNTTTSTLAIVLASLPIARATSGLRDFHTTLFLTDPSSLQDQKPLSQSSNSFLTSNLNTSAFTVARLFRPSCISLPQKPKKGDVILLRSCAVTSYARTASLLSSNSSAWALFSRERRYNSDPAIAGPPVEFGAEERGYVRGLWEWWEQLEEDTKKEVMEAVEDRTKKLEEKEEREKMKGRRLKGMGLRLAPGMGKKTENPKHELRDGKEWGDDVGKSPRTPRKSRGVRHELRDGKGWVDGESPRTSRRS